MIITPVESDTIFLSMLFPRAIEMVFKAYLIAMLEIIQGHIF